MKFDASLPVIPPPAHLHQLIAHVDAAHANELRQRCSTTGYGCCLAGGVVAYCSRTQSICAQSSTEAELIAANAATKVTKYLRFILHKLGYTQTEHTPIYEDNDSAIKIVNHSLQVEGKATVPTIALCYTPVGDLTNQTTAPAKLLMDYVPTIGTKINKDFGSKGFLEGEVTSGPHRCTVKGDDIVVWKVRYEDGDREEMMASEIAYWKAPVEEVRALN